jgi:hypothetical protein
VSVCNSRTNCTQCDARIITGATQPVLRWTGDRIAVHTQRYIALARCIVSDVCNQG